jgi:hypothetical protein
MSRFFDSSVGRDFLDKVDYCLARKGTLPVREQAFIVDMWRLYKSRKDAADLGLPMWEPSAKQINFINSIHEMLS